MIFDTLLSYDTKVLIALIAGGIWIYTRDDLCYSMIPRLRLLSVILVVTWIYLNYKDPLFLPIGLAILYIYSLGFRK